MLNHPHITIEAKDCCAFQNQEGNSEVIQHFITNANQWNVFHFTTNKKDKEELDIATFNGNDGKWYAGRLVGEATFEFKGNTYKIKINPRFGDLQLFKMLEEAFNIRFTNSKSLLTKQENSDFLIKKMISFLWSNLLAKANKHGLPRHLITKTHIGNTIKGKLNARKSIIPYYIKEQLISNYKEKAPDVAIATILNKTYNVLSKDYYLNSIRMPNNAQDAIQQLLTCNTNATISEHEYRKIVYKDIYASYKPLVDLSWDILKKKNMANQQSDANKDSFSFFIDMAEIWELYLRSILKKQFIKEGWTLQKDELIAYSSKDFRRKLIPDIVFLKDNDLMVWDAKYKRMQFDYFDYDRADFFQIHTYVNYYHQDKNVIASGLLYPLSKHFDETRQDKNKSNSLFGANTTKTKFVVDGIDYSNIQNKELTLDNINIAEQNFISRIATLIN